MSDVFLWGAAYGVFVNALGHIVAFYFFDVPIPDAGAYWGRRFIVSTLIWMVAVYLAAVLIGD